MKVESAAVGPQLDRGPVKRNSLESSVDETGGLFPRVPLQLGESGQCVGGEGADRTQEGVEEAARERGGKQMEEAGSAVSSISAVLLSKIGVLSPARPSLFPAPSRLGTLFPVLTLL